MSVVVEETSGLLCYFKRSDPLPVYAVQYGHAVNTGLTRNFHIQRIKTYSLYLDKSTRTETKTHQNSNATSRINRVSSVTTVNHPKGASQTKTLREGQEHEVPVFQDRSFLHQQSDSSISFVSFAYSPYASFLKMSSRDTDTQTSYAILGVPKTATKAEIQTAYRKMALKHHPDKGGSQERFLQITAAYATVTDESNSRRHDIRESTTATFGDLSDKLDGMGRGLEQASATAQRMSQQIGELRRAILELSDVSNYSSEVSDEEERRVKDSIMEKLVLLIARPKANNAEEDEDDVTEKQ